MTKYKFLTLNIKAIFIKDYKGVIINFRDLTHKDCSICLGTFK